MDILNNYIRHLIKELEQYKSEYYTNPTSIYRIDYLEQTIQDLKDISDNIRNEAISQ